MSSAVHLADVSRDPRLSGPSGPFKRVCMNWNSCGAGRRGSRCALALFLAFRFSCLEV